MLSGDLYIVEIIICWCVFIRSVWPLTLMLSAGDQTSQYVTYLAAITDKI